MTNYMDRLKATTFAVIVGTGGSAIAMPILASNNVPTIIISPDFVAENQEVQLFSKKITHIKDRYGLSVGQLSKILAVSRPTIYSWLRGDAKQIRRANRDRVEAISTWLEHGVQESLCSYLGPMLRRKLDPKAQVIDSELSADSLDFDILASLQPALNFKLEGMEQSADLDHALAGKKPLI